MKYREEMANALLKAMNDDPNVLIMGEGVADPKGIFGTTLEAFRQFPQRVMETPLSENMLTGACLGLALEGWKPILVHARCEFIMVSMEHLVNTIAKWSSVHQGRQFSLVIRALVGRGWGQGPNHSQAFHAMFAHVPGLRVLYPVDPRKINHWVSDAISSGGATIILEPRRLYEAESIDYPTWERPDAFIVTFGDVVLDAALAAVELEKVGIKAQVFPIEDVSAMPIPEDDVPVVVADTGHLFCGATAEVVARLAERGNSKIKRVGPPFVALPTSAALESEWFPSVSDLFDAVCDLLDRPETLPRVALAGDTEFRGPF
jgi:pyruvate/2-oxoglutarate/acetoin dehydrogenase E1 component